MPVDAKVEETPEVETKAKLTKDVKKEVAFENKIEDHKLIYDTTPLVNLIAKQESANKQILMSALAMVENSNAKIRMYLRAKNSQ